MRRYFPAPLLALAMVAVPAAAQFNPAISFVDPLMVAAGSAGFTLTVAGANFAPASVVTWAATSLTTNYSGSNSLTASVPAALLTSSGQVSISVVNPGGLRSNSVLITVLPQTLAITTTGLPAGVRTVRYAQTLAATGGSQPYVWEAIDALPLGLSLSSAGQLSGTPAAAGAFQFTVRVKDAAGQSGTKTLALTISQPPVAITTPNSLPEAVEGVEYSVKLLADTSDPPLRWSAGAGLPAGVTLAADGTLAGVPVRRGAYAFRVQVADATNTTATRDFTLTVRPPPLTITTISPLFGGSVGAAYAQQFTASGGTPPYAWSMQTAVSGLSLNPQTGSLAGTPQQAGSFTISVTVTDTAGVKTTGDFPLRIDQPELRISNGSPLPPATAGVPYQYRFLATGGAQPYNWYLSNALAGFSIDAASGLLSATAATPGAFDLVVSVRDNGGLTTTKIYRLTVQPGALRLTEVADTLAAMAGEPFSLVLTASGGTQPYSWSANGLPEGVELVESGELTGVPRTPGSFLFTVRVTDSNRNSATQAYRMEVTAPAVPDFTVDGAPGTANPAEQIPVTLRTSGPYNLPLTGELLLTFSPDSGTQDPAVQFVSGGRAVSFEVPAGSSEPRFQVDSLSVQTGTVAGTVTLALRLQTPGANLTPTPRTLHRIRIERSAPVITSATVAKTASGLEVTLTGYATTREITECKFRFRSPASAVLQTSEVTIAVAETFAGWFRSSESAAYGGQFKFVQPFSVQGDASLVSLASVTVGNGTGSTTVELR